ncbi:hypothetical protein [Streptomyces sp. 769]|uniref:hypothetical protein n=1 Tax=Streptomyces sp. 769 TaxID=1262452 RepID=UPI00057CD703|nr:hypothetical protein [Streptomyces sp. 769]AJC54013.1 hypothetical protein GZL_01413 [Streptomyces sp. 769]
MEFVKTHVVQIKGLIVAVLALFSEYLSADQQAKIMCLVTAALALIGGGVAQRVEDKKTADALAKTPPRQRPYPCQCTPGSRDRLA